MSDDKCDGAPTGVGSRCGGRGWFETEDGDRYCDCARGEELKRREGAEDVERTLAANATRQAAESLRNALVVLGDVIPITSARKPRSEQRLAADVHNAGLVVWFAYGATPNSRHYAELVQHGAVIARDPMPTVMVQGADLVLESQPVEVPGPNCLDKLSEVLGLTDAERALFRTRREDVDALVAEAAKEARARIVAPEEPA